MVFGSARWLRVCNPQRMFSIVEIPAGGLVFSLLGAAGTSVALRYPEEVNRFVHALPRRLAGLLEAPLAPEAGLELSSALITSLRCGLSLDAALEAFSASPTAGAEARRCARQALLGQDSGGFLERFLVAALRSGAPALASLQGFERALRARRRLQMKARASTGQCRAQAEVLSWLPWALAAALFVVDPAWVAEAARSPASWASWALAVALCGLGRAWIRRSLRTALSPKQGREEWEEAQAPELVLRLLSELAQGRDAETAAELSLTGLPREFRAAWSAGFPGCPKLARLRALVLGAAKQGGPLRDDLQSFLEELREETEARWEERVQRLPVLMLAPLFTCFFPGSLLVLAGLIYPMLRVAL